MVVAVATIPSTNLCPEGRIKRKLIRRFGPSLSRLDTYDGAGMNSSASSTAGSGKQISIMSFHCDIIAGFATVSGKTTATAERRQQQVCL